MPSTLDFTGNAVTLLGMLGVASTLVILISVFRAFYNSPYNK
jgi:hypothetical protein